MTNTNTFDVLVVYTESVATSATSHNVHVTNPFSIAVDRQHYSLAYAYFLTQCEKIGLTAAFTTSSDIIGPGMCKSHWIYSKKGWVKVREKGFAPIIFDKVSPLRKSLKKKRDLLFSEDISKPFNDRDLLILFNDKLKTYKKLESHTITTVNITSSTVASSIAKLERLVALHKNCSDFTKDFILKDRFGAGGIDIYKIGKNPVEHITSILKANPQVAFVLQPFARFDKGYSFGEYKGYTDIRIIYSQGKVVQRYIRTAKENDFRCNEHQGGKVIYIKSDGVPQSVTDASREILRSLDSENALFALDFIVSNNGNAYFLEGNINPGIYWGLTSYEDKVNTKKLIRVIVTELKRRTMIKNSMFIPRALPRILPIVPTKPLLVA